MAKVNSCETLNYNPCTYSNSMTLQDTSTHFCNLKKWTLPILVVLESTNFCSVKKLVLQKLFNKEWRVQNFIMKKEETINFCSPKKRTLQSL